MLKRHEGRSIDTVHHKGCNLKRRYNYSKPLEGYESHGPSRSKGTIEGADQIELLAFIIVTADWYAVSY